VEPWLGGKERKESGDESYAKGLYLKRVGIHSRYDVLQELQVLSPVFIVHF
jgi:hypothetical protein